MALSQNLGWVAAAGIAAAGYFLWYAPTEQAKADRRAARAAATQQRIASGPYVAQEREIAPGQNLRTVVLPSPTGAEFLDVKCFLYTHQEFKQATFVCPDVRQQDIDLPTVSP